MWLRIFRVVGILSLSAIVGATAMYLYVLQSVYSGSYLLRLQEHFMASGGALVAAAVAAIMLWKWRPNG